MIFLECRAREEPAAVAQARNEQMHLDEYAANDQVNWREVELHLIAWDVQRANERLSAVDVALTGGDVLAQRAFADFQIRIDERAQLIADAHRRDLWR